MLLPLLATAKERNQGRQDEKVIMIPRSNSIPFTDPTKSQLERSNMVNTVSKRDQLPLSLETVDKSLSHARLSD